MIFMQKYVIEFRMLSILHYCIQYTFIVGFFLQKHKSLQRIPLQKWHIILRMHSTTYHQMVLQHHIPIPPTVVLHNRIHLIMVQHLTQQMEQILQQWELYDHPSMSQKLHMPITDWSSKNMPKCQANIERHMQNEYSIVYELINWIPLFNNNDNNNIND